MLAHGIYLDSWSAIAFGFVGTAMGLMSLVLGLDGKRGALGLGLIAMWLSICSLGMMLYAVHQQAGYFIETGDTNPRATTTELFAAVCDRLWGGFIPPFVLGLLGCSVFAIRSRRDTAVKAPPS